MKGGGHFGLVAKKLGEKFEALISYGRIQTLLILHS